MEIRDQLRDFTQRYDNTYIWVAPPDSDEESLFHIDRITADNQKIANLQLSSPDFGKIVLNMGTAHTLRFKYPPVGVFQSEVDAYIFRRKPVRQYKRGICSGNSAIYPVWGEVCRKARDNDENQAQLAYGMVADAFDSRQYSYKDALKMLGGGKYRSVALKHNFSLMLSLANSSHYLLMYWEIPIAYMDKKNGELISMIEQSFSKTIALVKAR